MKKAIFCFSFLCITLLCTDISAQKAAFGSGDNVVGFGFGVGSRHFVSGWGYGYRSLPTFLATYERCIVSRVWDDKSSIGAGALLGYKYTWWSGDYDWSYSNIFIGARGALHYTFVENLDVYAGLAMGARIYSHKYYDNWSKTYFSWDLIAGARYYFSSNFGAFAELGYDIAYLKLGLVLKF